MSGSGFLFIPYDPPYDSDQLIAGNFTKFAGYTGSLNTTLGGMAKVHQVNFAPIASQVITFNLTGADPACTQSVLDNLPANGCGIHIHSGINCSAPGGHHFTYNMWFNMTDPWMAVKYTTTPTGFSAGVTYPVPTGLLRDNITNRVIMVHDSMGKPFACAPILLPPKPSGDNTNTNFAKATFVSPAVLAFLAAAKLLY